VVTGQRSEADRFTHRDGVIGRPTGACRSCTCWGPRAKPRSWLPRGWAHVGEAARCVNLVPDIASAVTYSSAGVPTAWADAVRTALPRRGSGKTGPFERLGLMRPEEESGAQDRGAGGDRGWQCWGGSAITRPWRGGAVKTATPSVRKDRPDGDRRVFPEQRRVQQAEGFEQRRTRAAAGRAAADPRRRIEDRDRAVGQNRWGPGPGEAQISGGKITAADAVAVPERQWRGPADQR